MTEIVQTDNNNSGNKKVLIADDDSFTRMLMMDILSSSGYTVIDVSNGKDALEKAASEPDISILISDINMPEMNGIELIKELNARDLKLPVIVLTGNNDISIAVEAMHSGASHYIVKDENISDTITIAVEEVLEKESIKQKNLQLLTDLSIKNEQLNKTINEVEEANKQITESINYAKMIQNSLLPDMEKVENYLPDSFFIWIPKDIVAGDIYFTESFEDGYIVAIIDCTGHGVPGAFMTMLASSNIKQIINEEENRNPAEILKLLNKRIKSSLKQDRTDALSDDGLDAAICYFKTGDKTLTYAGAKIPLISISNNEVSVIKGDKQSIGYKRSDINFEFTNHTVPTEPDKVFYLATDGILDQKGGEKGFPFGNTHLRDLLKENHNKPFDNQKTIILQTFSEYKRDTHALDDVTVIGFKP